MSIRHTADQNDRSIGIKIIHSILLLSLCRLSLALYLVNSFVAKEVVNMITMHCRSKGYYNMRPPVHPA